MELPVNKFFKNTTIDLVFGPGERRGVKWISGWCVVEECEFTSENYHLFRGLVTKKQVPESRQIRAEWKGGV